MNFYTLSMIIFAVGSFVLGCIVRIKRRDALGRRFILFSSLVALFGLAFGFALDQHLDHDTALWRMRLAHASAILLTAAFYHFILVLTNNETKTGRFMLNTAYCLAFFIAACAMTPWFIPRMEPMLDLKHYTVAGPLYHLYTAVFFTVLNAGFFILIKKIRSSEGLQKKQLLEFAMAAGVGFSGGTFTFFPIYGLDIPQYALFLMPLYPLTMAFFFIQDKLLLIKN